MYRWYPALFFLFLLLIFRFVLFPPILKPIPEGKKLTITGSLQSTPKLRYNQQQFFLQPAGYESLWVTVPASPRLSYGETIKITGIVKTRVLGGDRIVKSISFPLLEKVPEQGVAFQLRKKITLTFERYLPIDLARLLLGIVFGIKEPLSSAFEEQVRTVGLLHVIAASGMNITLLAGALVVILGHLFSRRVTIGITILVLVLYASLAGFQASIVRAAIMGGLTLIAGLIGRQYFGLWALFLTGYVMLFIEPLLLWDVGFQLSFLATSGIMLIKPLFTFVNSGRFRLFKEDLATTLSAQVTTLPVLLSVFGQFAPFSVLANVLVLWTIPPLMIIGGVGAIVSLIFEPAAALILYLTLPLLLFFQLIVAICAQIPFTYHFSSFPLFLLISYYMFVIILIWFFRRKNKKKDE